MKNNNSKRKKAWIGAVIGAAASLLGSVGGSILSSNAQQEQIDEQKESQNRKDTYTMANNLSAAYGNQGYVDEFQNKVTFKNGGRMKTKKVDNSDRLTVAKRFKCGGRKKLANGGSSFDYSSLINGISSGIGNVATAAINNSVDRSPINSVSYTGTAKESLEKPDYVTDNTSTYTDRLAMAKMGCRRKKCIGGKSKRS